MRFWKSDLKSNVHPYMFFAKSWCNMMCIKKNCSKSWCVWLLWPVVWWAASSLDGWYIREISAPELTRVAPDDKSSIRWQQQHQMTIVASDDKSSIKWKVALVYPYGFFMESYSKYCIVCWNYAVFLVWCWLHFVRVLWPCCLGQIPGDSWCS